MKNLVGFMVCGAYEKYLKTALDSMKKVCDSIVIVDNGADELTREIIEKYTDYIIKDRREWGMFQNKIKEDNLKKIASLQPSHILALDADEEFVGTREELEALQEKNDSWYLYIVNLIGDKDHYSPQWSFPNCRFYKYQNIVFRNQPLHCGSAPEWAFDIGNYSDSIILHYGLMSEEDRRRKALRYKKYDPNAQYKGKAYYDFLSSRPNSSILKLEALKLELQKDIIKYKQKDNKKIDMGKYDNQPHVRVLRKKDGMEIIIPKNTLANTLRTGNFDFIGEYNVEILPEAEVLIAETPREEVKIDIKQENIPKKRGRPAKK